MKVGLVDDDAVGHHDLFDRLVVLADQLRVVQVRQHVAGVDQRDDGVQADLARNLVVDEEGGGHRRGVGQAAGFDQDVVELLAAVQQLLQHLDQVFAHIGHAADAAVGHLEDLFLRTEHQVGIDVDLAELVISPNSFSITAMRWPCRAVRMWLSSVVLPEPRKPVRMVTGTGRCGEAGVMGFAAARPAAPVRA